jgi:hypothetical protein
MDELFRLRDSSSHDTAVVAWFAQGDALRSLAERWFVQLRHAGPDTTETLHDGCPTACVRDVAFAYVAAFSTHTAIGFFHGASLPDPQRLLEGSGKRMRHVKLRWDRQPDSAAIEELIAAAYHDIHARLHRSA